MNDDRKTVEDQELANMIASMKGNGQAGANPTQSNSTQSFKVPTPPPKPPVPNSSATLPPLPPKPPVNDGSLPVSHAPVKPGPTTPPPKPVNQNATQNTSDLAVIKQNAIQALRPLVGELNLPAEEKFNTFLLLIRSTDDKSLIKPAFETIQQISDDAKRAQALLDIVKEIDFFEGLNK